MFFFAAELGNENFLTSLLDFRSNLINWLLLIVILVWAIKKYAPQLIAQRQEAINAELELAAKTRLNAEEALAEQKRRIEQAGEEAEKIVLEAKHAAKQMVEDIKQQTETDITDLRKKFELAAHNERQAAIIEMRNIVSKAAIKLAQENLKSGLTANNKSKIANEFMGELSKVGSSSIGNETVSGNTAQNPQKVG